MYHELAVEGRQLLSSDEGYRRYCVTDDAFGSQLGWLRLHGYEGWNLSQALDHDLDANAGVAITFDDGCETDALYAAPRLRELGFSATFFVVTTWVGRPGYLSQRQLHELRDGGFELGAHSRSHSFLTDLDPVALGSEIVESKTELEQMLGHRVDHFSCPGGRWSPAISAVARDAGYRTVSTSRPGTVTGPTDPFCLPRTAIVEGMSIHDFERVCRGDREWLRAARSGLLSGAKKWMGNALYEKVRGAVLNR
jgi:peptidoglycan/xylan/chitin deacetylase (PgdA/CDA1 family)